jgi:hypothetical protein
MITEQLPFQRNYLDLSICFNERSVRKPQRREDRVLSEFVGRRLLIRRRPVLRLLLDCLQPRLHEPGLQPIFSSA